MPRSGRGGARQGEIGRAYPNRSDLTQAKPAPIASIPGQTYGKEAQQQAAQRAMPVGPTPTPPPANAPAQGVQPHPAGPPTFPWTGPSQRPNEPITAGLPSGPGPGPQALQGIGAMAHNQTTDRANLKALLGNLANSQFSSTAVRDLAAVAGAGE